MPRFVVFASWLSLVAAALSVSGCGAGHKIEQGGESVDRALDKDLHNGKREVHDFFTDDAGTDSSSP